MKIITPGHLYALKNFDDITTSQSLKFVQFVEEGKNEKGEVVITINDGTTNEEVLAVLIDRIQFLNAKFPCCENSIALVNIETALLWLNKRTADRQARGVEGKAVA